MAWRFLGCLYLGWILAWPAHAELTRDDIAAMSRAGVMVRFPHDRSERHTFSPDIDPDKLLTAEMIDFSGHYYGDNPDFYRWLAKFTNLRKLVLADMHIHATPDLLRAFVSMEELQKLDLSKNPLFTGDYSTAKLIAIWGSLPRLDELNLTGTDGTVDNYGSLTLLKNLNKLYLGDNPQLCARSPLKQLLSWTRGNCLAMLELRQLPLSIVVLSGDGLADDPLPFLPVGNLRELSLDNNNLRILAAVDLPQLEYWNLAGNDGLKLADDFGSILSLTALKSLHYDAKAVIPAELKKRLTWLVKQEGGATRSLSRANASAAKPLAATLPILKPETGDEIRTWLTGADKIKHDAAWRYLATEAKTGDGGALHWQAQAYHQGWGIARDWRKARKLYQESLNAGDTGAKQSIDALDR